MPEPSEALLRRLEWTVLRRLDGVLQGDWRSTWRGAGVDLADLREYQHGDDVRHIDWNVSARMAQPYVRQFVEDRELTAWFLVDRSRSMHFGSETSSKLDLATGFVALLARVFTRQGNRVGALLYGTRVDTVLPPRASRLHVLQLVQRMRRPVRSDPPAAPDQGTVLADLLHAAAGVMKRRALVFVVSDFISQPGWAEPLARLAQRHDVVAVRLWDAWEMALPDAGVLTVQDAESGAQCLIDSADPAFRSRYATLAGQHETALRTELARSGADVIELATHDDLLESLLRLADLRRLRARQCLPYRFPAPLRRAAPAPQRIAEEIT
jgi:uncharacterized protein (DUF58 family)